MPAVYEGGENIEQICKDNSGYEISPPSARHIGNAMETTVVDFGAAGAANRACGDDLPPAEIEDSIWTRGTLRAIKRKH